MTKPDPDARVSRSLQDFRFPDDAPRPTTTLTDLSPERNVETSSSTHIELPPLVRGINIPCSSPIAKAPTPWPRLGRTKSTRSTALSTRTGWSGITRAKLKRLPARAVRKLRRYGRRLRWRLGRDRSKASSKIKARRPTGGSPLKACVQLDSGDLSKVDSPEPMPSPGHGHGRAASGLD